jgi:hypothetical protein
MVPFDIQARAILSTSFITACVSGARGGKTRAGVYRTIMDAVQQPGYLPADRANGEPYLIAVGAPTYPLLEKVVIPNLLSSIPSELKIGSYNITRGLQVIRGRLGETHIRFISGQRVESWYGMRLNRLWMDEFALISEALFDEFHARLLDREGIMFLTGTPQGPNWAKERIYDKWVNGEDDRISFFTWKTVQNPFIPRAFIQQARKDLPPRYFRRTFEATWETFAGQIYEDFIADVHCVSRNDYSFFLPSQRRIGSGNVSVRLMEVVAGVDWGWAPGHAGAIIVVGKDPLGRWWLLDESVAEAVLVVAEPSVDSWVRRAQVMMAKWGVERFYCDHNPEHVAQFSRAGIPVHLAKKDDVKVGIETVARFLHIDEETKEPRLFVMGDLKSIRDELTYYHWEEGKEKPAKIDDNAVDALRYVLHSHETTGNFKHEPGYAV